MFKDNYPGLFLLVLGFICLALFADAASAANMGASILPMNQPLQQVRDLVTGPFAWTVSIIALVIAGAILASGGDIAGWAKTMLLLAMALSMVVFANNLLTSWFSGAVIA